MSLSEISTTETDEIEIESLPEDNGSAPRRPRKRRKHRHRIDKYFRAAVKMKALDLHMKSDNPPR